MSEAKFLLIVLAVILGLIAARPKLAGGIVVALLALVPLGTAALLYVFLGLFPAAHLLLLAGALVLTAGILHAVPNDSRE